MVNMVNNQMVGSGHYHPVHLEAFPLETPGSVKSVAPGVDVPFIFNQPVVIVGIDDGEFSLCERDFAEAWKSEFAICAGAEIGATAVKWEGPPCAGEVGLLLAHEYRLADTDQEGRKRAVIATV
jgi:hypothetical protein